jgi:hypothetical protein
MIPGSRGMAKWEYLQAVCPSIQTGAVTAVVVVRSSSLTEKKQNGKKEILHFRAKRYHEFKEKGPFHHTSVVPAQGQVEGILKRSEGGVPSTKWDTLRNEGAAVSPLGSTKAK